MSKRAGKGRKRVFVVAASVALLVGVGASSAFAGEVKGPLGQGVVDEFAPTGMVGATRLRRESVEDGSHLVAV